MPSQKPNWSHFGSCNKNNGFTSRSSQLLQQPLPQLMQVGNTNVSSYQLQKSCLEFYLEAAYWACPCGASATCSLRSSNRGKKDVEAGGMLSSFAAMASVSVSRSGCITSWVHGLPPQKSVGCPSLDSQCGPSLVACQVWNVDCDYSRDGHRAKHQWFSLSNQMSHPFHKNICLFCKLC